MLGHTDTRRVIDGPFYGPGFRAVVTVRMIESLGRPRA